MAKGFYHYIKENWKKPDAKKLRELMVEWRKSPSVTKVEKPLRLDRARTLGYKAKKGIIVARVRVLRGGRKRHRTNKGRKSKRHTIKKVLKMNYKWVAEQRAQKKFPNLEVLNSYKLSKDGKYYFYEIILIDKDKPEIKNSELKWISNNKNKKRVYRGLTSSGKKSRGLRKKGHNKNRPSVRAGHRRGK